MLMSGGERQEKTQLKIEKEKAVPCGNKYKLKRPKCAKCENNQ